MTEQLDFGALRELLHGPVSPSRWRGLLWLVSGRAWDVRVEEWLPYAQGVLDERWPDETRVWLNGLRWSRAAKAANQLVRAYHITREATAPGVLFHELHHWARHAPPLTILGIKRVVLDAPSTEQIVSQLPPTLHTLVIRLHLPSARHLASALLAAPPPALVRLDLGPDLSVEGEQEVWRWIEANV
jgi:hypothetical protein